MAYHSALLKPLDIHHELDFYESNGSVVFCHDISKGDSSLYSGVDAIYSEPAWRPGYSKFRERAGIYQDSFKDYLIGMLRVIECKKVPTYMILGKHMLKNLCPENSLNIKLGRYEAYLGTWNAPVLHGVYTNKDVLTLVSNEFSKVLDFNCGYGNLAEAMGEKNRFVCSDINKKCVYYIAHTYMSYNA